MLQDSLKLSFFVQPVCITGRLGAPPPLLPANAGCANQEYNQVYFASLGLALIQQGHNKGWIMHVQDGDGVVNVPDPDATAEFGKCT